jgi:hypothetical protein
MYQRLVFTLCMCGFSIHSAQFIECGTFCERHIPRRAHGGYFIGERYSTRGPIIIGRCNG